MPGEWNPSQALNVNQSPSLFAAGEQLLAQIQARFPDFPLETLCLRWQWVAQPDAAFRWRDEESCYPASVIKLFYMAAAWAWQSQGKLAFDGDLPAALDEMIRLSSNDATGYVLDRLTDTTSGPELDEPAFAAWAEARQAVNRFYRQTWPQHFAELNACQKTWGDGPLGRERQYYGADYANRNRLTARHSADFLQLLAEDRLVNAQASQQMRQLMRRNLDPVVDESVENQVKGFLAEQMPTEAQVFSKAGWTSQVRHDVALVTLPGQAPFILVAYTNSPTWANNEQLLPFIGAQAVNLLPV